MNGTAKSVKVWWRGIPGINAVAIGGRGEGESRRPEKKRKRLNRPEKELVFWKGSLAGARRRFGGEMSVRALRSISQNVTAVGQSEANAGKKGFAVLLKVKMRPSKIVIAN
jgi:hypothetical protein